ncbi:MAG TPA: S41 family peptidase [Thermomicrobiales bacterium]|nr:S41 family peptidase [Thermomicrobiales bacterium]
MTEITVRKPVLYTFLISTCALIALSAFFLGAIAQREWLSDDPGTEGTIAAPGAAGSGLDRIAEVEKLIAQEYYGRPQEGQSSAEFWSSLEGDALEGLAQGLDDYSTYLPPDDQKAASDQLAGTFEGIGVWVASRDGKLTIVAPIPGSPAEEAGIQAGDVILSIDGKSVDGLTDSEALDLLKGPAGEKVSLSMQRGESDPYTLDVERRNIPMPVVTYKLDKTNNIAVIRIIVFGDKTASELDSALQAAKQDGVAGIILDLRNNGGGWVQSAQETIGRFVSADAGAALYEDFDPNVEGDEVEQPIVTGDVTAYDLPMVVLVNNGTASAAEIVAGALHDYGRATIVGETTYGKGSVQRVHEFDDGSSFRLTFAHWLTPNKHAIDEAGIEPDFEVAATPDNEKGDAQLEAAIQILGRESATPVAS